MKMKSIFKRASILAVLAAVLVTGVVFADDINNDDGLPDTDWETITIQVGGNVTVGFYIAARTITVMQIQLMWILTSPFRPG